MGLFKTLNNNIKYDIWGNFVMSRQLSSRAGYGYLAKSSFALARAILSNRTITFNNRQFFDVWNKG